VPAGIAYEICRDILGPGSTPDVQPGGSITAAELQDLVRAAVTAADVTGRQADSLCSEVMYILGAGNVEGDWHVLPDLITMLTARWCTLRASGSNSWLSTGVGQSLRGAAKAALASAYRASVVSLMQNSCTMPDQPLHGAHIDLRAASLAVEQLCDV
jgi:hypothetical protein